MNKILYELCFIQIKEVTFPVNSTNSLLGLVGSAFAYQLISGLIICAKLNFFLVYKITLFLFLNTIKTCFIFPKTVPQFLFKEFITMLKPISKTSL